MARVTKKMLEDKIEQLEKINDYNMQEISKLNSEIDSLRDKENIVSREEFDFLLKQLEDQKHMTCEYKKLYDNLRDRYRKERDELVKTIKSLQEQIDSTEIKLNERGAGRKAYSNKQVIENIYNLYLDGSSLQGIADELNWLGSKTKRGKDWSKSSIRFILLNPKNVANGFIDEDTFNCTVKLLNENKKRK
ncbi:recombinase family protein [Clostridium sp. ZS2-4]|uniref:recombinase family protein n=1 Tax=Clostridium sp. ZS2-4 TaxID=2987703 RepID=UPI00227B05AC|nr:recombinase family protein [Clostridium sp. ZS2-4]MCY6355390.1 recombinase family protein [Clostridium sp. ZS2-4]